MRDRLRVIASAVGFAVFTTAGALAAGPDDGKAAFEHRVDTMKRMGHALYVTIGRVARGKAALGPDTVDAAQTIVTLSVTIPMLFPAGSNVGDSRVKPEIFAAAPRAEELAGNVQAAAAKLATVAKADDTAALADAAKALNDACEACHGQFRKPE